MPRVLTDDELAFWRENGYVIVPEAAPQANLDAVIDVIWEFMDMVRDDPDTWYRSAGRRRQRAQAQRSRHGRSSTSTKRSGITASIRACTAPSLIFGARRNSGCRSTASTSTRPARADWDFQGFVHWDIDTSLRPLPKRVQGVLSLVDVPADAGGLQVVAGFHRRFQGMGEDAARTDRDPRQPDMTGLELQSLSMNGPAIWSSGTACCRMAPAATTRPVRAWRSTSPCSPAQEDNEALRQERISLWRERKSPRPPRLPGRPAAAGKSSAAQQPS